MGIGTMTAPIDKTKEYGRRPYINSDPNDAAHPDEMEEILDKVIFDYQLQKHSEFKKPYISPDFHEMEYYWSGFPGISFPDPDFDWPWDETYIPGTGPSPLGGPCVVRITSPLYCEKPAQGYPMLWSGPKESLSFKVFLKEGNGDWYGYRNWGYDPSKGIWPLEIQPPSGGWNSYPDPDQHQIRVQMEDAFENICSAEVSITCYGTSCCTNEEYVAPTGDSENNPETINRSSVINLYIKDGCAPYLWTVSGTGFSLTYPKTEGLWNHLSASVIACGIATITVTDYCGYTATIYVRCTSGQWVLSQTMLPERGTWDCGVTTQYDVFYEMHGPYKHTVSHSRCSQYMDVTWDGAGPACGSPIECYYKYFTEQCRCSGGSPWLNASYVTEYKIWQWEC
jgi:hypothetical protein